MNINELAKEVHENAVKHGWWDKPPTLPEALCLIHAELSEALEGYRNGAPFVYGTCALAAEDCKFSSICDDAGHPDAGGEKEGICKPEGIAVELADVILRTLDLMAALGVDVDAVVMAKHRYNLGREFRHGGESDMNMIDKAAAILRNVQTITCPARGDGKSGRALQLTAALWRAISALEREPRPVIVKGRLFKRWYCPACFQRVKKGGRFCHACGQAYRARNFCDEIEWINIPAPPRHDGIKPPQIVIFDELHNTAGHRKRAKGGAPWTSSKTGSDARENAVALVEKRLRSCAD